MILDGRILFDVTSDGAIFDGGICPDVTFDGVTFVGGIFDVTSDGAISEGGICPDVTFDGVAVGLDDFVARPSGKKKSRKAAANRTVGSC